MPPKKTKKATKKKTSVGSKGRKKAEEILKAAGGIPNEASQTKYPTNVKELIEDDVRSDLLEYHEDILTGRFYCSTVLGPNFGESKRDTEAYINQIHADYARRFAKTILFLSGKAKTSEEWKLLIKNAKMQLELVGNKN